MEVVRAAAVQFEHTSGDKAANLNKVETFVHMAAAQGARLIVFPECCITGYWFLRNLSREEIVSLSEPVFSGPSCRVLGELARAHGVIVGAGLVERDEDGTLFNTYVVAMPDGRFARHRKLHCFISEHMKSGNEFTVFDTPLGFTAGILTCYDNNIGENVRITALMGAEVLIAPHQTGGCTTSSPFAMGAVDPVLWENRNKNPEEVEAEFRGEKGRGWLLRWLPARAHDNGLFLVFSNGVGVDDNEIRTGNAMILDPYGRILAETWVADDQMVVADMDGSLVERSTGRRWLRTRRPELYELLARRTGHEEDTRAVRFQ
jgi:predicted amidohydrolase